MVARRATRCLTVLAVPGQRSSRRPGAALGQARELGQRHETIGVDRALLRPVAACGNAAPHVDAADHTGGAWVERVQIIYPAESRAGGQRKTSGSGIRSPKRTSTSSGNRRPAPTGHRRRRHDQRQGQAGLAGARLGELRSEDHLQRYLRRDAGRPAERPGPARDPLRRSLRRRSGSTAPSRARASMSTPTATATRASSRPASPKARAACSPTTGEIFAGAVSSTA